MRLILYGVLSCVIGVVTGLLWGIATDDGILTSDVNKFTYLTNIPVENGYKKIMSERNKDTSKYKGKKSHTSNPESSYQINSYASESIYTIQTGSFISIAPTQKQFDSIVQGLNEKELDYLRIEKIGKFYSLRLGKFEDHATAKKFFQAIKPQLSTAIIMKAYIKDERIIRLYKSPLEK